LTLSRASRSLFTPSKV